MVSSDHFGRENILYKGLKVLGKWEVNPVTVTEYVLVFKNRAPPGYLHPASDSAYYFTY